MTVGDGLESTSSDFDKQQAIGHWQAVPCGIGGAGALPEGSAEFFGAIDRDRYWAYAPWLLTTMGFDRYPGKRLLEVGCGMGTDLAQFAKGGAIVHGIDLVPRHLDLTRARFDLLLEPVQLARADAESMPFRDSSYDVVYSFGVLHHTPHTSQAIDEVRRVLKPGGTAIISVYHRLSLNMLAWLSLELLEGNLFREPLRKTMARIEAGNTGYTPLVKVYSRSELRRMLCGFSSVRFTTRHVSGLDFIPGPLRRMLEPYFGWYLIATCQK